MLYRVIADDDGAVEGAKPVARVDDMATLEDVFHAISHRFDVRWVPEIGIVSGKCHASMLDMATATVSGIDAMTLIAATDLKESWYGAEIDKTKYRIVLEDETEDSVYLKIVKKEKE